MRMPPRTGPLDQADLDHVPRHRSKRGAAVPTSWSCCRTGATSTSTRPSRSSARSARRGRPPEPTWSSAGTRTGCRGWSGRRRARDALARQLRLRHGVHAAAMEGMVLEATCGATSWSGPGWSLPDGPGVRAAPVTAPRRADPHRHQTARPALLKSYVASRRHAFDSLTFWALKILALSCDY